MIPAFVIHASFSKDRDQYVKQLQDKAGATVIEAIVPGNPLIGCCMSHLKVAQTAKNLFPDSAYIVFEDDCVLNENWQDALTDLSGDVCYLGYSDKASTGLLFGTWAMLLTPKARDALISWLPHMIETSSYPAYDHLCWKIWEGAKFAVGKPDDGYKYCNWARGLLSLIQGGIKY